MKKYRYDNPNLRSPLHRARPYIFIFAAWNFIAYSVWQYVSKKASESDPGWHTRSEGEKIAFITGSDPEQIAKHKITLFQISETSDS